MKAVDDDEGSPPPMKRPMSMKDMMMRVVVIVGLKEASWCCFVYDVLRHGCRHFCIFPSGGYFVKAMC